MTSLRDVYLKSFDGVTLHDGSTRFATDRVREAIRAQSHIIDLPSGQRFDATPTTDPDVQLPGRITGRIAIRESTDAAAQTDFNAIADKLGQHGTLTVQVWEAVTTLTGNARLVEVRNVTPVEMGYTAGRLLIAITFELLENLS